MSSYTQPSTAIKRRRAAPSDGAKYPKKTRGAGAEPRDVRMHRKLHPKDDFINQMLDNQAFKQLDLFEQK